MEFICELVEFSVTVIVLVTDFKWIGLKCFRKTLFICLRAGNYHIKTFNGIFVHEEFPVNFLKRSIKSEPEMISIC